MSWAEFREEVVRRKTEGQTVTQIAQWSRDHAPLYAGTQKIRAILKTAGILGDHN